MKNIHTMVSGIMMLIVVLASSQPALADEEWIEPGTETFKLGIGIFLPAFDTSLQVNNRDLDLGSIINLEDDLGLDKDRVVFWASGIWRFRQKHRLSVSYFQFARDSVLTALQDITIGEETFPAGATLRSNFEYQSVPITYHYSFIKSAQHELAGTFGLHWSTIDLKVQGDAFVGGGGQVDGSASAEADGPLPLFGVNYAYHANKRWTSGIHAEVFALDLSDDLVSYSGTVINLRVSTEYWLFSNTSFGVAINWFRMDVDVDDNEWQGAIDYEYIGPQIYAAMRF